MATKELPSAELVRQLLDYDPETGKLFWKERPREIFQSDGSWKAWNTRYAGMLAFTSVSTGYHQGSILGIRYLAHRVIWCWMTTSWPEFEIDHENGNGCDNSWKNLQSVTHARNLRNQKRRSTNSSGYTGVFWVPSRNSWQANIRRNYRLPSQPWCRCPCPYSR